MVFIAIAGATLLTTFLITVVIRRAFDWTALIVGSLPPVIIVIDDFGALAAPIVWFPLLFIWAIGLAGAALGASLARLVHAWWRSA
jgi:K+ transporter